MQVFALPLARILLSLMFIFAGYTKVIGYGPMNMEVWTGAVKGMMIPGTTNPLPNPELLAQISGWAEFIAGIMLFIGILSRITAFGLFVFVIVASVLGHAFWTYADAAQAMPQIGNFLKNMGVAGGLLLIIAAGGGALGIDGMFRRRP
ncbi:MAG: DoxX family protein [Alphaproteobacteria bacterium]